MFPPIKYTIDTPPLSMEDSLPSHSRAMYKILRDRKIIDRNYLEKHNINNIDSLESFIFGKINNYKIESHDYQELKEIFCLIHIWGGNTGRNIFIQGGTGFNWNKISIPYEKLVIACCEIIPDSQNTLNISSEQMDKVFNAIITFHNDKNVNGIGPSFLTKHTRFWLHKNNPNNPLTIYDLNMTKVMDKKGVYFSTIQSYWRKMIEKANIENVSLLALERQIFIYYQGNGGNSSNKRNERKTPQSVKDNKRTNQTNHKVFERDIRNNGADKVSEGYRFIIDNDFFRLIVAQRSSGSHNYYCRLGCENKNVNSSTMKKAEDSLMKHHDGKLKGSNYYKYVEFDSKEEGKHKGLHLMKKILLNFNAPKEITDSIL
jgi:hypothetical protein